MHSEQSNSTPVSHHVTHHSSLSLQKHLSDAWHLMTDRLLGMILQMLTFVSIQFVLFIVSAVTVFFLIIVNPEFQAMMDAETIPSVDQIFSQFGSLLWTLGIVLGGIFILYLYFTYVYAGALIYLVGSEKKVDFGEAIMVGFKKALPLFVLAIITGSMTLGGFILFFLPGLAIMFMLLLSLYVYILDKTSMLGAMRRSVQMVTTHFALVLGRYLVLFFPALIISTIGQVMYKDPETIASGFILNMIFTTAFTFFGLPYYIVLYRHLDKETPKDKPAHMTWMYIVSILGLGLLAVLLYFGVSKGIPFVKEQIAAEIAKENATGEENTAFVPEFVNEVPSSCGVLIPLTGTYENSTGRKWIYEERWVGTGTFRSLAPQKQLQANGVLLGMVSFKTNDQRIPQTFKENETFTTSYAGFNIACTANTEDLTLDEFVTYASKIEDATVTVGDLVQYGDVTTQSIWIEGIDQSGDYYKEPLMLGVTDDGSNLFYIKIWADQEQRVVDETYAILDNLSYSATTETLKDPSIKTQTKAQTPTCQQYKIYEGEFASDKCYSAQDYKDLQYYMRSYNSAIFDYNAAVNKINVTCC